MVYEFVDFQARLERLVQGKGSILKTAPLFGAKAENCIYVFAPENPELQAMLKKEVRTYVFRQSLLNKRNVDFVVAENYQCNDFDCTGHLDNPDDENSGHIFRNSFPEDINGAYILFRGE
ncbi:MAG: hypothetical protein PHO02_01155 [Candidatus Nanoarchaeia archaeon]|nr:hypothetical protein [Candidatus Nanoarchaeia archaeon]